MSVRPLRSIISILFPVAVFVLILTARVNAGCTCGDCVEMLNRYKQVNCLLEEICKERQDMRTSGKANQKFDFGDYNKNYLSQWKSAMGKCRDPNAKTYAAGNTDGFCGTSYSGFGDSYCMYGSVKAHEENHVATCKNTFKTKSDCTHTGWPSILQTGYADCLTWDEYYTDDVGSYNKELDYLRNEINFWQPICKELNQWCLSKDAVLDPPKCSSLKLKDLLIKIVRYFTGTGRA